MYHGLSSALPARKLVIHRNGPDNLTTPMFTLATASFGNVPQCPPNSGRHTWDAYASTWAGWFYVAFVTGVVVPGPPVTSGSGRRLLLIARFGARERHLVFASRRQ